MKNNKSLIIIIMTILVASFISFVIIMQHNFTNPDFATAESAVEPTNEEENSSDSESEQEEEKKSEEVKKDEPKKSEAETITTKYVTADLLNVREGPGTDTSIVGVVTLDQEVDVEGPSDSNGWIKITTDDFTGYVNEKYLEE